HNRGNHEDLVQIGMIGLLVAAERFDATFGKSFEAFAIPTIIVEIKRFIRDKTWSVHVLRRIKELGPQINRAVEELKVELQRSTTVSDIANYLDEAEEAVLETMEMTQSYKSLSVDYRHDVDSEGGAISLLELVGSDEDGFHQAEMQLV